MADKSQSLILDALARVLAEPGGLPLLGSRAGGGLFAANAAGKAAAQASKEQGFLRVLRAETRGKASQEICTLTEKGLALLLEQTNPKQVLEAFLQALDARHQQASNLLETARASLEHLEKMREHADKVLQQLSRPQPPTLPPVERNGKHKDDKAVFDKAAFLLSYLTRRHESGALDDCPLPELFRQAKTAQPGLTLGQFHDLLRRLHDEHKIYLHPWTGPLYELPEPGCALLGGA